MDVQSGELCEEMHAVMEVERSAFDLGVRDARHLALAPVDVNMGAQSEHFIHRIARGPTEVEAAKHNRVPAARRRVKLFVKYARVVQRRGAV